MSDLRQNERRIVADPFVPFGHPGYGFVDEEHQPFKVIGRGEYERLLEELAPASAGAESERTPRAPSRGPNEASP